MSKPYPIAIACSDLHLTLTAPACRADEDWLAVQAEYLNQLKQAANIGVRKLPILCAGDIFDRWNAPPELINFALTHLPDHMLCVPGQHDLPNHLMEQKHRSGYGVLARAGKIVDLTDGRDYYHAGDLLVFGFGWEQDIYAPVVVSHLLEHEQPTVIAVIHRYCWANERNSYPGAPAAGNIKALLKQLRGYDAVVFGDNHKGFSVPAAHHTDAHVFNCGGFIRRKSDEINYQPRIGKVMSDGSIRPMPLATDKDRFHDIAPEREEVPLNMREFLEKLDGLGEHGLDFKQAVLDALRGDEIDENARQIILRALEQ